jgi:hypothetical protein
LEERSKDIWIRLKIISCLSERTLKKNQASTSRIKFSKMIKALADISRNNSSKCSAMWLRKMMNSRSRMLVKRRKVGESLDGGQFLCFPEKTDNVGFVVPKTKFDKPAVGPKKGAQPPKKGAQTPKKGAQPPKKGAQPAKPGVQPQKKGAQPAKPGVQPAKPGVQPAKPGVQPAKPGVQPPKSGVQPAKPGVQPPKPGVQPAKPTKPAPAKPAQTPTKPAPAKPAQTPTKPAQMQNKPINKGAKPGQ